MDQRVKGGTPPATAPTLDPASAPEGSKQDLVAKKNRTEGENGSAGKKEEERQGSGRKKEGEKGDVLELLIEGRCGSAGQQELQASGRETSSTDGKVRNGLQAKRTKKPPKILESYVCKPTIRTYQRQSRGGLLRGDAEGGAGQQSKSSCTTGDANRDLDAVQATSKKTASAAPPPPTSSSSASHPPSSTFSKDSVSASVPAVTCQGSRTAKQVPNKLADKTEESSNVSIKKDSLPSVNGQPAPAGAKPFSPATDQAAPSTPSTARIQAVPVLETRNDGSCSKNPNGLVPTAKQKRMLIEKSSANTLSPPALSKNKAGKHGSSSTDSSTSPSISQKELFSESRTGSPSHQPVISKLQTSSTTEISPAQPQGQNPSAQLPLNAGREKEKKAKKDRQKSKKLKRDRLEAGRATSESRKEDVKKKKKDKRRDGKSRHGKDMEEKSRGEELWAEDLQMVKRKAEKIRENLSPVRQRTEENNAKCSDTAGNSKLERGCTMTNPGRQDERDEMDDCYKPAKQVEPAPAGDGSKLKEQDILRHAVVSAANFTSSAPPPLPMPTVHAPISPPFSSQGQDSRPLKKRKARRPSWTKMVHRAQRAENQEALSDSLHNSSVTFPQVTKTSLPSKPSTQQSDESHTTPSSSLSSSSSPLSYAVTKLTSDLSLSASRFTLNAIRKRGRPKSHSSSVDKSPPRLLPNNILTDVPLFGCDEVQKAPVLEPSPALQRADLSKSSPKKRGRPPKRSLSEDQSEDALNHADGSSHFHHPELGSRQLKIRKLINEMKKRKKRIFHQAMLAGYVGKESRAHEAADGKTSLRTSKSIEARTVNTLSALSSSFGSRVGPQINVSKRGTIYMGKRRGRKPKSQTVGLNSRSQNASQPSLFSNPPESSFFSSNQLQSAPSHPFPSPSLTHSSGAQSPYSEGSLTEPTSSFLFSHPFSLPSPSSSCASSRPPSSSSLSPFVKKSCPCQGRHHFPFHQSSCKLSSATLPSHHTPASPGQLKEATPSPRSESHSDETLPSDSGIGTDNNSISERGEMTGTRGMLRLGQGAGVILGSQRLSSSLMDRPFQISNSSSHLNRHANPISSSKAAEQHRDRHRHRRRDYNCPSSCTCMHPCPCPGHNKCTHSNYYRCLGHNALKRQKSKHKKKQLHMQDPEFLAELDDVIAQLSEVHIGRRSWARTSAGQGFDGAAGRRHHSSTHSPRSNIFRINLNGFYSPHPSSFSAVPPFTPQPFFPCHCSRKPDRRQCGCPPKFPETVENMGFYSPYPTAAPALYHHLPGTYPLPPPHQYQPHHAHFLLNPARFHRRRSRFLKEGVLGGDVEGDLGERSSGGGVRFTSSLSYGCGRSEHKHKQHHRHCERDVDEEEELQEDEEDDRMGRRRRSNSKARSRLSLGQREAGSKGVRGSGSMLSLQTPWLHQNGSDSFSSAALPSSSSAAERYKHTSLTSLGLGSSHLSSFGGGWGGLGQSWTKFRSLATPGFGNSTSSWAGLAEKSADRLIVSDEEDEDVDDFNESEFYGTSSSPTHTNLFTSAAMATGLRGVRSGFGSRNPGADERSGRRDEPAWTERRDAGLQGDSRSRVQQKSVPTPDCAAGKNKRRPGRPRKHPLPSATSSPTHSSATPSMSPSDHLPAFIHNRDEREVGGKNAETVSERGGGHTKQQVTEQLEMLERGKKGRKRKHGDSPCHQSVDSDKPECDTLPDCLLQPDVNQAPFQPESPQRQDTTDGPPRKTFLRAGLYSDDYKTTDPSSQALKLCSDSLEYTPGEHEYTLLPAPIHVGKYLRLKRIHFQLPYDVMWLWEHNQLYRQPAVPLKRKRRYCRMKERTSSSQQREQVENSRDLTSLFPHLDMEPLTSGERSFVIKHHVFLVRNWELVRDRQIRMRIERERERDDEEEEEGDSQHLSWDGASGDDSHIKSGP
ncbi:histone-lysine N-methyltransferase ASH1L isoform X3 [Oryzias latipes]|uniref:histone-lysine N-methyltransferase ASH1L isoform X3 n=1 Tax=Oryzias latipes TaxID=8090 RepID=UPI000CE255ED|nr:histone-lysine N-methyltransferase ASH1L isoform X3 [Oryzias latipes]